MVYEQTDGIIHSYCLFLPLLERVLKLLSGSSASHFVGDLTRMKGA
ncbi:MAG: hypothetical protein RHS_1767 [Robinsoniella sp. RHS]|nr:MAG: hypothetical protein RHS_1767 [Robinsoniella sp. RHS]